LRVLKRMILSSELIGGLDLLRLTLAKKLPTRLTVRYDLPGPRAWHFRIKEWQ
jgi:hypothetical protein